MASDITIKAHDTYPPLVTVLYDTTLGAPGKAIDLATATAVKMVWLGLTTPVKTGVMTKLTVVTPTATMAIGSNVLTAVSSFTNIVKGSGVIGSVPGVPAGAIVGDFDTVAATITLTDQTGAALNCTASGAVTLTVNKGTVSYSWVTGDISAVDTYSVEFEITWPGGIQTVPNSGYRTMSIVADLEAA